MKFATALALATVCLLSAAHAQDAEDAQKQETEAVKQLVGDYAILAGHRGGEKIAPERLKGVRVRIATNSITTFDKDEKEVYVATYKLDTSKKPWQIIMTPTVSPADGETKSTPGLIELERDTIKLIYALPNGKPPVEFKTGDLQQMFVLKKITP